MTLAQKSLEIAKTFEGIQESPKGSNSGPEVNKFLARVGLKPGNAWCMAMVYYCVDEAAKQLGLPNPLVRTGHVLYQWNNTTARKLPKTSAAVKPGDVFIMKFKGGLGHAGFVEYVKPGIIHSIDGNSNDEGSREGFEWCRRERPTSSFLGFIQL